MKVYNNIAYVYDCFINWEERIKREDPFYQHLFMERLATSLLDIGCGSGGHAIHFAQMGYNVIGIDSAKDMVAFAQQKSEKNDIDIEFQCLPMTDYASRIQQKFDAVICVGNNLPHLLEASAVKKVFTETIASMKETGVAIFHVLNYHRIMANKRRDFPANSRIVDDKEYLFLRHYDFLSPHLDFHFASAIKENGQWTAKSMQMKHHPWKDDELIELAKEAGFTQIMTYGGYDFSEFDAEKSHDFIMVCELVEDEGEIKVEGYEG
jgi:glycine/sarcosine N-methyltransferase